MPASCWYTGFYVEGNGNADGMLTVPHLILTAWPDGAVPAGAAPSRFLAGH
jgi:hypothetical protein